MGRPLRRRAVRKGGSPRSPSAGAAPLDGDPQPTDRHYRRRRATARSDRVRRGAGRDHRPRRQECQDGPGRRRRRRLSHRSRWWGWPARRRSHRRKPAPGAAGRLDPWSSTTRNRSRRSSARRCRCNGPIRRGHPPSSSSVIACTRWPRAHSSRSSASAATRCPASWPSRSSTFWPPSHRWTASMRWSTGSASAATRRPGCSTLRWRIAGGRCAGRMAIARSTCTRSRTAAVPGSSDTRSRDALRGDPALAQRHAALKAELAARHHDDREACTHARSAFVR